MNATCPPLSLLADPSTYASLMHCLGSIELPIHVFCGYIILFKTPAIIQSVKFPLLYYHFWCSLLDLLITLLMIPYPLVPDMAIFTFGMLRHLGVSAAALFYVFSVTNCMVGVSLIGIFENRFFVIANLQRLQMLWSFLRYLSLITNHLIAITYFLPIYFLLPNQLTARNELIQRLPCLPKEASTADMFVVVDDHLIVTVLLAFNLPLGLWLIGQAAIYSCLTLRTLFFNEENRKVSKRTVTLRKKFFIAILIQAGIPFAVAVVPLLFELSSIALGIRNHQGLNNLAFLIASTHGLVSSLAILMVHEAYRKETCSIFRKAIS